jgi:hypothetical protein
VLEFTVMFFTVTVFAVILFAFNVSAFMLVKADSPLTVNVPDSDTGPLNVADPANDVVFENTAVLVVMVLENVTVPPATRAAKSSMFVLSLVNAILFYLSKRLLRPIPP